MPRRAGHPSHRSCRPPAPGRAAAVSPVFLGRLSKPSCPPPPLAPTVARRTPSPSNRAVVSPEPSIPRLAAATAVARLRQGHHRPALRSNSVPSNLSTTPRRPRPAPPPDLAGFLPTSPAAGPEDPIAGLQLFLRANPQSKGISVRI
jgi:hypothetical protein